jgi:hypothetical protein
VNTTNIKITNWGSVPVTIGNLSIKMWVNESKIVNMQQWVQLGQIFQADDSGGVNVNNTGFTAIASWLANPCTVDSTHKANQVIVFSTGGSTQAIPANGGYWDRGFDLGIGRNNSFMDDNWADDYSKTQACNGNLVDDAHFALYYEGILLKEWTGPNSQDDQSGAEPCCGSSASGGQQLASAKLVRPTTPEPVFSDKDGLIQSVVAAPNVSRDGDNVRINFALIRSAQITLSILALSGELVYQTEVSGTQGVNSLIWEFRNQTRQAVASGLYLYVLRADDGTSTQTARGKIAVIR